MRSMWYKDYEIVAKPIPMDESTGWRVYIDICRRDRDRTYLKHFWSVDSYASEEEAVEHCLEFGQKVIDGKIPEIPRSRLP